MTDTAKLVEELRAAADASGNPGLKPYSLYALAADALEAQAREIGEVRDRKRHYQHIAAEHRSLITELKADRKAALSRATIAEARVAELVRVVRLYCEHDKLTYKEKVGAILHHPAFAARSLVEKGEKKDAV